MPKRVCLQAGHKGLTTGPTGAPGERDWTTKIVPIIADKLIAKGIEVYETDALGNADPKVTSTDWDYFLAIHYDADIYNERGGFVDFPDPSVDDSTERSKQLATTLAQHYFKSTGIPERPQRSNANTKFYYMWSALTSATPCVLIECGIGNRKPEDYTILRNYELISSAIADGILEGLGAAPADELSQCQTKLDKTTTDYINMKGERDRWRTSYEQLQEKYAKDAQMSNEHIVSLQHTVAEQANQIAVMNKTISDTSAEKQKLMYEINLLREEKKKMEDDHVQQVAVLTQQVTEMQSMVEEISSKVKELKKKLDKGLSGYSKRELITALFQRR